MTWTDILKELFEIVIFPLLGVGTAYLCYLIKVKIAEIKEKTKNEKEKKYLDMLDKTICEAVIATNQTYVESLKKQGKFDAEAQKEAFNLTYNAVMAVLTDEAKHYLAAIYGDLTAYIATRIEAEVNVSKIVPVEE